MAAVIENVFVSDADLTTLQFHLFLYIFTHCASILLCDLKFEGMCTGNTHTHSQVCRSQNTSGGIQVKVSVMAGQLTLFIFSWTPFVEKPACN